MDQIGLHPELKELGYLIVLKQKRDTSRVNALAKKFLNLVENKNVIAIQFHLDALTGRKWLLKIFSVRGFYFKNRS